MNRSLVFGATAGLWFSAALIDAALGKAGWVAFDFAMVALGVWIGWDDK